jgi:hypothetical protein
MFPLTCTTSCWNFSKTQCEVRLGSYSLVILINLCKKPNKLLIATVEYHGVDADYPPIKVVIADGSDNEDVIVKVSDEGGGIPRSNMKRIWSYVSTV